MTSHRRKCPSRFVYILCQRAVLSVRYLGRMTAASINKPFKQYSTQQARRAAPTIVQDLIRRAFLLWRCTCVIYVCCLVFGSDTLFRSLDNELLNSYVYLDVSNYPHIWCQTESQLLFILGYNSFEYWFRMIQSFFCSRRKMYDIIHVCILRDMDKSVKLNQNLSVPDFLR